MTSTDLQSWLQAHYGRGGGINRLAFVASMSATLVALGEGPISLSALNTWLARNPPERVAGRQFEGFLALVLERKGQPAPARIYTVTVPVDAETAEALEEIGAGGTGVEDFLRCTLYAALEDEIEIHRASKKSKIGKQR